MQRTGFEKHQAVTLIFLFMVSWALFLFQAGSALGSESYVYEHMWPGYSRYWNFRAPVAVAVDDQGFIYVANADSSRLQKYSNTGRMVTEWSVSTGSPGPVDLSGVAVDRDGFVYTTSKGFQNVSKYSPGGAFLKSWGAFGPGEGQFKAPSGIATDDFGNVYVADLKSNNVQKFTPDGAYLLQWGETGDGDGQFNHPCNLAVASDFVYVLDAGNHRVQKFSTSGEFIGEWGEHGDLEGQFGLPTGIAIDASGYVYVVDQVGIRADFLVDGTADEIFYHLNFRVQKFSADGQFVSQWFSQDAEDGQLTWTNSLTVDKQGRLIIADPQYDRLLLFDLNGSLFGKWGNRGPGVGEFSGPIGITGDEQGFVYVTDTKNHRVQKFTAQGQYVSQWGGFGTEEGKFVLPRGIAIDSSQNLYVADTGNNRIQKFSAGGQFLGAWGTKGSGEGQFESPEYMAFGSGLLFVADTGNLRIQVFSPDGTYQHEWSAKQENKQNYISGFGVDQEGNVFVAETIKGEVIYNYDYIIGSESDINHIRKFTSTGNEIRSWNTAHSPSILGIGRNGLIYIKNCHTIEEYTLDGQKLGSFGKKGTSPGLLMSPGSVWVDAQGKIFVADTGNNRIQVFHDTGTGQTRQKAVIVAGGPIDDNDIWDGIQNNALTAYNALVQRGFTDESIRFFSPNIGFDLNFDGLGDVMGASWTALRDAVVDWAADADGLLVYLAGHGRTGVFDLDSGQALNAGDLDAWLDQLQENLAGRVTVIIEACYAGSFIPSLAPPPGKQRILITSAGSNHVAYIPSKGNLSFSSSFWTAILSGQSLGEAFAASAQAITQIVASQSPQLEATGDGVANTAEDQSAAQNVFIGNGVALTGEKPLIGSVSSPQVISGSSAVLRAVGVNDPDGIERVWAVIQPPGFNPASVNSAITEFSEVDLKPDWLDPNDYKATWHGFNSQGTYQVFVYAMDGKGNTSAPSLTTVSVGNPQRSRAVIVAGGRGSDAIWPAVEASVRLCHEALTSQGYSDEDIFLLSREAVFSGRDDDATKAGLQEALTVWAAQNTRDLVLYMVGPASLDGFAINGAEQVTGADLNGWLGTLQATTGIGVTVVIDADFAGSFIAALAPPEGKNRIVITSCMADQPVDLSSSVTSRFSKTFWNNVLYGTTLWTAFKSAAGAITQTALLDDNGNGLAEAKIDGLKARQSYLGSGVRFAQNLPRIGAMVQDQQIFQPGEATIWASVAHSGTPISRVWAKVTPPAGRQPFELEMALNATAQRWERLYDGFSYFGTYGIAIHAMDNQGAVATIRETGLTVFFPIQPGDVNGDGQVDLGDAVTGLQAGAQPHFCPGVYIQADVDRDGRIGMTEAVYALQRTCGIRAWVDSDGDGIPDDPDNCPEIANFDQTDWDDNGVGDVCDDCTPEILLMNTDQHVNMTIQDELWYAAKPCEVAVVSIPRLIEALQLMDVQIRHDAGHIVIADPIDAAGAGAGGNLSLRAGGAIRVNAAISALGTINFQARQNITLGRGLKTANSSSSAVVLTSTEGAIVDAGDAEPDIEARYGKLTLSAVTGIGADNLLDTKVKQIEAQAMGGNIGLNESGEVTVTELRTFGEVAFRAGGNAMLYLVDGGQTVDIQVAGSIWVNAIRGVGDITIKAGGNIDGGTITGSYARIAASTIGLTVPVDPQFPELDLLLFGESGGKSAVLRQGMLPGAGLESSLMAPGTVQVGDTLYNLGIDPAKLAARAFSLAREGIYDECAQ